MHTIQVLAKKYFANNLSLMHGKIKICSSLHCGEFVDPHAGLFGRGGLFYNDPHDKLT